MSDIGEEVSGSLCFLAIRFYLEELGISKSLLV